MKVGEGAKPPLQNLFPLSFEGEGDTGGEVKNKFLLHTRAVPATMGAEKEGRK